MDILTQTVLYVLFSSHKTKTVMALSLPNYQLAKLLSVEHYHFSPGTFPEWLRPSATSKCCWYSSSPE